MYKLIVFLLVIIAALQYRLWLGDGGIREYRETVQRINDLKQEGERRKIRNAAVAADVRDLRDGDDAIEERARHELGMIKAGETYVQVFDSPPPRLEPTVPEAAAPLPARKKPTKPRQKSRSTPSTKPTPPPPVAGRTPQVNHAAPKAATH